MKLAEKVLKNFDEVKEKVAKLSDTEINQLVEETAEYLNRNFKQCESAEVLKWCNALSIYQLQELKKKAGATLPYEANYRVGLFRVEGIETGCEFIPGKEKIINYFSKKECTYWQLNHGHFHIIDKNGIADINYVVQKGMLTIYISSTDLTGERLKEIGEELAGWAKEEALVYPHSRLKFLTGEFKIKLDIQTKI